MENNYAKITSLKLSGIKNPTITINGFTKKDDVKIIITDKDGKELRYINNNMFFNNEFSYKLVLQSNIVFVYSFFCGEKVLITKVRNSLIKRIINKISSIFSKLIFLLKNYITYFKNNWDEYKFNIPKDKKKQLKLKLKLRNNGTRDFYETIDINDYNKWIKTKKEDFNYESFNYNPLISIVIKDGSNIEKCIKSIKNQTYKYYDIYLLGDRKINGITNIKELTEVKGDYLSFINSNSVLDKDALYYIVNELNNNKKLDVIYTDSDELNSKNKRYNPNFKPDYSPDTLLSYNYISNICVIKKELLDSIGNIDLNDNYDLVIKTTEKTNNIYHIPKILYSSSYSSNESSKNVILDTLKRRNLKGRVLYNKYSDSYSIEYEFDNNPLVSIIIPTKNHYNDLKQCISSLLDKTTYINYEIIIIDNGSDEDDVINYEKEICKKNNNIKLLNLPCEFNFSYLNNEAVKEASGEYIVLLNNDTKIITSDWIEKMLGYASLEHVGTVGAKLLYDDMTIQHAGIVMGLGGIAAHAFTGYPENDYGLYKKLNSPNNVMGNTAACLMISKKKYDEVNGLEEELKVAYNDVDFNLKLYDKGYYNVFLPSVELIHFESKSRGLDIGKEKYNRFLGESNYIYKKWKKYVDNDPFYNKNLSKKVYNRLDKEK